MSDSGLNKNARWMKTAGRWLGYVALLAVFGTAAIYAQSKEVSLPLVMVAVASIFIAMALRARAKMIEAAPGSPAKQQSNTSQDRDET
jgi:hypothetical protein